MKKTRSKKSRDTVPLRVGTVPTFKENQKPLRLKNSTLSYSAATLSLCPGSEQISCGFGSGRQINRGSGLIRILPEHFLPNR
jgi:hypothetical protein